MSFIDHGWSGTRVNGLCEDIYKYLTENFVIYVMRERIPTGA